MAELPNPNPTGEASGLPKRPRKNATRDAVETLTEMNIEGFASMENVLVSIKESIEGLNNTFSEMLALQEMAALDNEFAQMNLTETLREEARDPEPEAAEPPQEEKDSSLADLLKGLQLPALGAFVALVLDETGLDDLFRSVRLALSEIPRFFAAIAKRISSAFNLKKIKDIFKPVANLIAKVKSFFAPVTRFINSFFGITKTVSSIVKPVAGLLKSIGKFVPFVSSFIAIFDFVGGFTSKFKEAESVGEGILEGILGGFTEVISGFLTRPLDLLKDLVGWTARKLGFPELEKVLDSFSIDELFRSAVKFFYDTETNTFFGGFFNDFGKKFDSILKSLDFGPGLTAWFRANILDASGERVKIFGNELPDIDLAGIFTDIDTKVRGYVTEIKDNVINSFMEGIVNPIKNLFTVQETTIDEDGAEITEETFSPLQAIKDKIASLNPFAGLLDKIVSFFGEIGDMLSSAIPSKEDILGPIAASVTGEDGKIDSFGDKVASKAMIGFSDEEIEAIAKKYIEGKETGGPIKEGEPYVVGEAGPELIIPSSAGRVIPAPQTGRMLDQTSREVASAPPQMVAPVIAPQTNDNRTIVQNKTVNQGGSMETRNTSPTIRALNSTLAYA